MPRPGGGLLSSHMKFLTMHCRDISMSGGIPCALVRNWVIPPTIICTMRRRASRVGFVVAQERSDCCIRSIFVDQTCVGLVSFPIQVPRILVGWPSSAIQILSVSRESFGCGQRVLRTLSRCGFGPIGMISVFSRLNLAPDAVHQVSRMFSRVLYLSFFDR
jgi:hypothetical protein